MKNELFKILSNSIVRLNDANGIEIPFEYVEIKRFKAKYSSAKEPSKTLFVNGNPLTNIRRSKIKVTYKCNCGVINTIHLSKFLLKTRLACNHCSEMEV